MKLSTKIAALVPIAIFLLSGCATSKRVTSLNAPLASSMAHVDIESIEEKYGVHDGVYLDFESIHEHTGRKAAGMGSPKDAWMYYRVIKRRYVVLNPDDEALTTFRLSVESNATLNSVYLYTLSPDSTVSKYGKLDMQIEQDSDGNTVYKFAYPDVQKGTVIEEGFELRYLAYEGLPPIDHEIPLQFTIPCEKMAVRYAYPDWWQINVKQIGEDKSVPIESVVDPVNKKIVMSYTATDVPALKSETYSPYFKEVANYLEFQVTKLHMAGSIYNAPTTWSEVMTSFKKFATNKDGFLSNHVKNTTQDIIQGLDDQVDMQDAIITYIQENIEIATDGKDRNFKNILKDGVGNPYRIVGLAQSMLLKAGINAKYLLVHSARDGYFDQNYISASQIRIPAVRTTIAGKHYVFFPYIKIPAGQIPKHFVGQQALAVNADPMSKAIEFWTVPAPERNNALITERYDLSISEDGLIDVTEEKTMSGIAAFVMRSIVEDLDDEEQTEFIEELLTYEDGDVDIRSSEWINLGEFTEPLTIKLNYTIDNLVTLTPDEILFQTAGLFSPTSGSRYKIDTDDRQNPIRIYADEVYEKNINVSYPASWSIATELKDVSFENELGKIDGTYSLSDGKLVVNQKRELFETAAPKEAITDLLQVSGARSRLEIPTLIFSVEESN